MRDQYQWLIEFLSDPQQRVGKTIAGIIPDQFEQYYIIEWNYGIIKNFPFGEYPDDSSDIELLNKQHEIKKAFGLFLNNDTDHLFEPITIKELAERFKIPYSVDTVNELPYTPGISTLSNKTKDNLHAIVKFVADTFLLNLYVDDLYRFPISDITKDKSRMSAEEYVSFVMEDIGRDSCSYLFPDDHAWCFVTTEDYPCIVFATNSKNSKKLASVDSLEYFEVDRSYQLFK